MEEPEIDIKKIRRKLRLTQEQFAEKIGVAFSTVNRWEKNHFRPSKLALKEIAKLSKGINKTRGKT